MNLSQSTPRLLVVDDDEGMRTMLGMVLASAGYAVDTAEDGVEGLAMLRANKYDLLVSDNQMPRLTGLEMIKQLHTQPIRLPIIMTTTTLKPEDLVGLDIPPVKLLVKPYSLVDLLALVNTMLTTDYTGR